MITLHTFILLAATYCSTIQREFIVAFSKQVTIFILLTVTWGHSVVAFTRKQLLPECARMLYMHCLSFFI